MAGGLSRRTFIQGLAGGALTVAAAACSAGGSGTRGAQDAAAGASTTPAPTDQARPWWLQGGFAPVAEEVEAVDLEITGALPPTLAGLFVRNGSNPATGESPHWFLGDGMVHGVRIADGRAAWYRNRWVRTPLYEERAGFGEVPPGGTVTQSNVSVVHHGGRLLTLGEVGLPFELDPADLATKGPYDFAGRLTTSMTAHPKIHPATGDLHFFGYGFVPPYLTYHVASADGSLRSSEEVAVGKPTMIHDFAITEGHAVFWELPVVFDVEAAVAGSSFPFTWDPDYGARIGVLRIGRPASEIRWVEIEPCFVFHGVNAWEERADVVVDVCRHGSMFAGDSAELGGDGSDLRRWRIDTSGTALGFRDEILEGERLLELPTVDRRSTGRPTRHAWLVETVEDPDTIVFRGVVRRDGTTGALDSWAPGPTAVPGELTFVPGDTDAAEGEGWVLTYTTDLTRARSDLVVLDATDLAAGPVARVHLPSRVPFGFHGTWVADEAV